MPKSLPVRPISSFLFVLVFAISFVMFVPTNHARAEKDYFGLNNTAENVLGEGSTQQKDVSAIVGQSIRIILSFVGVVFLLLFFYGGYRWFNSRGRDKEVEEGKEIMISATSGLLITLAAFILSSFVISSASKALAPKNAPTEVTPGEGEVN